MKKITALLLILILVLTGCGENAETTSEKKEETSDNSEKTTVSNDEMFTERDCKTEYDSQNAIYIELNGNSATASSDTVLIDGTTITITENKTHILSGTLDDGMLIVDAADDAKLQIVLDNAHITSSTSAAIYVRSADKVFLTTVDGSSNSVTNGGTFSSIDENNIDGAIFSKQDLTLNGLGLLTVSSPAGHGIVCKDDLVLTSGTYNINCGLHGLDANNSIRIKEGALNIQAQSDGLHAEHDEDEELGFIYIAGGTFSITTGDDGIHSSSTLTIAGGKIDVLESYEGLESLHIKISDGDIHIVASDDGLNAAGGVDQSGFGGQLQQGGPGGGSMAGGGPGQGGGAPGGGMSVNSDGSITISGGTLYIIASGDGIDANGTLEISGGHTTVVGPTMGDTATLDYDVSGVINGGTFIGTGASGMAQTFDDSSQGVIAINAGQWNADTEIVLKDEGGNVILTTSPELDFSVVILSSPNIKKGESYTIYVGDESGTFEAY